MANPFASMGPTILATFGAPNAITVRRYGAGSFVNGVWQGGAPVDTPTEAAVMPAGPKEIEMLPEAERSSEAILIFTNLALRCAAPGQQADRIIWQGRTYRAARQIEDWTVQAEYAWAIAVREGGG